MMLSKGITHLGLLLLAICLSTTLATNKHKLKHQHTTHKRSSEFADMNMDIQQQRGNEEQSSLITGQLAPFDQQGKEHCFLYNGQIASGYAPWVSTQRAMTRMEARVCISVFEMKHAVLRLDRIRVGQRNEDIDAKEDEPREMTKILPSGAFQQIDREAASQMKRRLELAVEFKYVEGSVERIQFHAEDQPWSKNVKKAVLNLIQLNLKAAEDQQENSEESRVNRDNRRPDQLANTFQTMETSIEGTCQTSYTVLSDNNNEVNVTKSINFNRCQKLADVGYGFQVEPIPAGTYPAQQQSSRQAYSYSSEQWEKAAGQVIPKEKLDRSTIVRYVLEKKESGNQYAIQRVELLSEYVMKSSEAESSQAMQTIAVAELVYLDSKKAGNNARDTGIEKDPASNREETLVYNVDAESMEKLYYMHGDSQHMGQENTIFPFQRKDSQSMVKQAETHLKKMVKVFEESDRTGGIDPSTTTEHFEKLVELMRMCTIQELKSLDAKAAQLETSSEKANVASELYADALAVCATHNTISVLVEKILKSQSQATSSPNNVVSEIKAAQLLKILGRGAGLPSISDTQVDLVMGLCSSTQVEKSNMVLKQSCWLTFGTMVGELAQQNRKTKWMGDTSSPMKAYEKAQNHKMELYKSMLVQQLEKGKQKEDVYERVLALKAIGNAGIPHTLPTLKSILNDQREVMVVRVNAIDALRRLRHQLSPERIQAIVLPIYENTEELDEVRIAAFSTIMQQRPQKPVIDQIAFTMAKERSEQVQGFVYSVMKAASESPIPEDKICADHLRNAMKLAKIDEEQLEAKHQLGSSNRWTSRFYSSQQQEGAFLNVVQIFSDSDASALPTHMSVGLDTFFNGQFNRNSLKMTMCQKDIEKLVKQIFELDPNSDSDIDYQSDTDSQKPRGFLASAANKLRSIVSKLKIKGRKQQQEQPESHKKQSPFFVASFRLNDVDVTMIPINMDSTPTSRFSSIRRMQTVFAESLRRLFSRNHLQKFELNSAMVLNSRAARIPTSVGLSLRLQQSMYVVGQVKASLQAQNKQQFKAQLHTKANWIQTQKMECRLMTYCSGVQSSRAVALNLPIEVAYQKDSNQQQPQWKLALQVPQEKTRLVAVSSLPATYLKKISNNSKSEDDSNLHHYHRVKSVQSEQLQGQVRSVKQQYGKDGLLGVPILIQGRYQKPRKMDSLKELVKVIMSGDNHIIIDLDCTGSECPKEIRLNLWLKAFQPTSTSPASSIRPKLEDFYSKTGESNGFSRRENGRMEDEYEQESSREDEQREQSRRPKSNSKHQENQRKFTTFLDKFANTQKRNYKHTVKVSLETSGSSKRNKAELEVESICDSRLRACETNMQAKCSPLGNEQKDWKMEMQVQTLYPEHVNDIQELLQESNTVDKQQKFFCHIDTKWGRGSNQREQESIKVNIQGEPSVQMIEQIQEQQQDYTDYQNGEGSYNNRRRQNPKQKLSSKSPFIDQYQVVAEYSLKPETDFYFQQKLEQLKANNFWNTYSKLYNDNQRASPNTQLVQRESQGLIQGQAECTLTIDPLTNQHANVTIRTPNQRIWIRDYRLGDEVRPMQLVRRSSPSASAHSTGQAFVRMLDQGHKNRAQCKVGMKTVDTFDGVAYRAPISKCYTVLAKDCAHKEHPRFVVMMKSLQTGGEEKKIKIITPFTEISIQPTGANKLKVKLNGEEYTIDHGRAEQSEQERKLREQGIEFESDYQDQQTIVIDLGSVAVKFNGKTAKIQLSDEYKNLQCGLCGNFNDDADDELRMNDDELAGDLKTFHRSYALQENSECEEDEHEQFYADDKKHSFQQNRRSQKPQQSVEPKPRTLILEYNHKVCFSLRPVNQCPEGWFAAEQEDEEAAQLMKRMKVQFTCLDRQSIEAKRLRSVIRRSGVAEVGEYPASFVEAVVVPETCTKVQY